MNPPRLCTVYRSPRVEQMYLYVDHSDGLGRVPEGLLARFGDPHQVLILPLRPDRQLARADAREVLRSIDEQGYYLQLPPREGLGHEV